MASNEEARGRLGWYDLMTTDIPGAIAFYTKVVGWETEEWCDSEPYTMWKVSKGPIGGVMDLPEDAKKMGAPPSWMGYGVVSDVTASCKLAEKLGGKVLVQPMNIPEVGAFAVLSDPQGAVFAMIEALEEAPGHDDMKRAGEVSWNELMTTDYQGAFSFYESLFGWTKLDAMDMGPEMGGIYQMFGRGKMPLGGMFNKPASMPGPTAWLFYFNVDDLDAALERVASNGGKVLNGPMEVPGGDRVAQCADPQGAAFALHAYKK
ncbi:MAG: VOC family protein [Myxococcota bacterium]